MNLRILLRNFIIKFSFLELLHPIFIILARNRIVEISVITKCRKKYNRDNIDGKAILKGMLYAVLHILWLA